MATDYTIVVGENGEIQIILNDVSGVLERLGLDSTWKIVDAKVIISNSSVRLEATIQDEVWGHHYGGGELPFAKSTSLGTINLITPAKESSHALLKPILPQQHWAIDNGA